MTELPSKKNIGLYLTKLKQFTLPGNTHWKFHEKGKPLIAVCMGIAAEPGLISLCVYWARAIAVAYNQTSRHMPNNTVSYWHFISINMHLCSEWHFNYRWNVNGYPLT